MYGNGDFGDDFGGGTTYAGALSFRQDEQKTFDNWFNSIKDKAKNRVEGKAAIEFFQRSNLNRDTLKEIWSNASKSNSLSLNQSEFFIAMRMISLAQNGRSLKDYSSSNLPLPQMGSMPSPSMSAGSGPGMTRDDYNRCVTMYNQLDPTKKGALTNDQVTTMLKKTGLAPDVLGQAWNMIEWNSNNMAERPFVIALLYLLIKCRNGEALPSSVPAELKRTVNEFEGKAKQPDKKLDDPFAALASSLIGAPTNPPPSYSKPATSSYQGSLDSHIKPPESMKNILPKAAPLNRGPKIDPSMQSVLDEQDTDFVKGSQLQSLDDDGEGKGTSYYISQLNSLNSERIKLKNSIGRQRADIRKEEDYMIQYQSQINKLMEDYTTAAKELEEILTKKATTGVNIPVNSPPPYQPPNPRPSPVNTFPTNPSNAYPTQRPAAPPVNTYQPSPSAQPTAPRPVPVNTYRPPSQSPQHPPNAAPQFAPRPSTPANNLQQPRPTAPSFQPTQGGNKSTQEAQGFEGGDSMFGWGNDDFGNTGVVKGNNTEAEFDFN